MHSLVIKLANVYAYKGKHYLFLQGQALSISIRASTIYFYKGLPLRACTNLYITFNLVNYIHWRYT